MILFFPFGLFRSSVVQVAPGDAAVDTKRRMPWLNRSKCAEVLKNETKSPKQGGLRKGAPSWLTERPYVSLGRRGTNNGMTLITGVGKLDRYVQKNENGLQSYTIHENKLEMD